MKLSRYIEQLNELVEENPEMLEFDVVYAGDNEGNAYDKVYYEPTVGYYEDREFHQGDDYDYNAVCIN